MILGTPGCAGRVLTGSASLPSLRDRLRRPPARWCWSATGERHAGILAVMPPADPSPEGGSLRSRRDWFRLNFAPKSLWGAKLAGLLRAVAASPRLAFFSPLRPRWGYGENKEKGIADR